MRTFRVGDSWMPRKITAQDVINYERNELGNTDIWQSMDSVVGLIPANRCQWVFFTKEDAQMYQLRHSSDETTECLYSTPVILAGDSEGGYLICELQDLLHYKEANDLDVLT